MSMIEPVNLASLKSLNAFGRNQLGLAKSVEKLSTGLSINSPKDSPANFSISEKMRSYVQGLKQASMNAQTGMSYLQSAESATTEITGMLQRMRELSVEASNSIYTNNDRNELQKEVDQLREEIGRMSAATEFNSTKILTGSTAGSWLSNNKDIQAILTGNIADANYKVDLAVTPGKNQVLKSQIMSLAPGELGADIRRSAANTTNVNTVYDPKSIPLTSADYTLTVSNPTNAAAGDTGVVNGRYFSTDSNFQVGTPANVNASESGYMIVEFVERDTTAADAGTRFKMKFVSAVSGKEGEWIEFTTGVAGSMSATYTSNGFNIAFELPVTTAATGASVNVGDKFLVAFSDMKNVTNADNLVTNGGGVLSVNDGKNTTPTIVFTAANTLTKSDNNDGIVDVNEIPITIVTLDEKTGTLSIGGMKFGFLENGAAAGNGVTKTGTVTIDMRGEGEAATTTTKLSQLANFTDADGNKIMSTGQELTIRGNGGSVTIYLEPKDTLETLAKKISTAMIKDLNMDSGDVGANKKAVGFISQPYKEGFDSVGGTIVIQSTMTGASGDLAFLADERLLKALGFAAIQTSEENISKLTVTNSHTGESLGEVTVSTNRVKNIINGVEITLDSRAGVKSTWNEATRKIDFSQTTNYDNLFTQLHMVDNRSKLQIGVRQGESLDITIPEISLKSLGLEQMSISTVKDAQKSITQVENALKKVISVRATIGAQINRLENTVNNLKGSEHNMTTAESLIRDLDVASESSNYAMQQLMSQTSTAILAQANQIPSMVLELIRA